MSDLGLVAMTCTSRSNLIRHVDANRVQDSKFLGTESREKNMNSNDAAPQLWSHLAGSAWTGRTRRCSRKRRGGSPSPSSTSPSSPPAAAPTCGNSRTPSLRQPIERHVSIDRWRCQKTKCSESLAPLPPLACVHTVEVGDGVGDGHGSADALAASGHVLAEQKLREPLLHQLHLCACIPGRPPR
jgi:hypothetical protein